MIFWQAYIHSSVQIQFLFHFREQEKDFIKPKFQESHIKEQESSSPASEIASLKIVGETPKKLGGPKSQMKKLNVDASIQEEFTYRVDIFMILK